MDNKTIAELHRNAESMGLSVMSRDLPRDICGLYDDRHKLILLADWLNQRQRRCTLCHELIHAKHHDPGCGSQYGLKCERRCRRETGVIVQNVCPFCLVFLCGSGRSSCSSCMGGELEVGQNVCPEWPVRPCGTTVE